MPDLPATTQTTANVVIGGSYQDTLELQNDRDWIGVNLVAGQNYRFNVSERSGSDVDTEMGLYNPLGGFLAYNDDGGTGLNSQITYTAAQTGRHFIQAGSYGGSDTGDYLVQAASVAPPSLLDVIDWGSKVSGATVRVYFATPGVTLDGYTSEGFNGYERGQFLLAFDRIEAVSGLTFQVVSSASAADFRLVLDINEVDGEFLGYFNPPGESGAGIGVFDGSSWNRSAGGDLESGGTGFNTIVHELLHGLGLAHPHDNGGTSSIMTGVTEDFDDYGDHNLNQGVFTAMSYNTGYFTGTAGSRPHFGGDWGHEAGPMALDIAVLQEKYGVNPNTNSGNNIYTLDTSNGTGTQWLSIWDTGGWDEIRATGSTDATIDLRRPSLLNQDVGGGHISAIDGVAGGFTIAANVMIEVARGGGGDDVLYGNVGANFLGGGAGADRMYGGRGNDFYVVDNAGDQVLGEVAFSAGGGIDTVRTFIDYVQPENIELVRLTGVNGTADLNVTGNDAPGTLVGNAGDNILIARGGNDQVIGNGGNDMLTGNTGVDTLVGGAGADQFIYTAYADSRAGAAARDVINGFDRGADRIDLGQIDANTTQGGNQAFSFIGTAGFSGAGQVRLQGLGGANAVLVEADHNGDGTADLQIFVNLTTALGAGDFIL